MACKHERVEGRKPGTERCKKCSWTFPCADKNCGHSDCIDFRGELPKCYYCGTKVDGNPSNFRVANAQVEELRVADPNGSWGTGNVVGCARSFHHACRV